MCDILEESRDSAVYSAWSQLFLPDYCLTDCCLSASQKYRMFEISFFPNDGCVVTLTVWMAVGCSVIAVSFAVVRALFRTTAFTI
ncbi:hypothetical protein F2P79_022090 [Pimephales promelas]|nr:hypothetical protein F2P79_022090 [Pimephales promelas]